jgi:acyl-CoA synthetase (AMP-forming)/AMP-acid ligase II
VVAYMVLKAGAAADPDELKAFCKARMSPFKVPKAFVAMDALPTNAAGKILKRELRRAVMESDKE